MILPTLRHMQYLLALNTEKSFSKAADTCHVTQSTISAGIKELENILGQNVIDRSKRKVIFTPLGQDLIEDARLIIARTQNMVARAQTVAAPMSGPLRLGVIPTIAPYVLPDILPRIRKHYPALELQIFEDMSDRLVESLRQGEIDLALMAFPFDTPDMEQKTLFTEDFQLASPLNTGLKNSAITPDDLDPGELLLLDDGHCLSDHALLACDIQLPRRRRAYSASSLSTLLQMVVGGYGITLVPQMAVTANAIPKKLKLIKFSSPAPTRDVGLVWRPASPQVDDFMILGDIIARA